MEKIIGLIIVGVFMVVMFLCTIAPLFIDKNNNEKNENKMK